MSESQVILPITASADGRQNMFYSRCAVVGQGVSYAACLWRHSVLEKPGIKVPADWNICGEAVKCGKCQAADMRHEEVLQGRAIYFRARSTGMTVKQEAAKLHEQEYGAVSSVSHAGGTSGATLIARSERRVEAPPEIVKKRPAASSMLDAMGDGLSYADAINASSVPEVVIAPVIHSAPPAPPPTAVIKPLGTAPAALPGESPLAMARRLAAQRQSAST